MPQPFALAENAQPDLACSELSAPDLRVRCDASTDFDRFLDELAERWAQEPACSPRPVFAPAESTPFVSYAEAPAISSEVGGAWSFSLDEEGSGHCLACGEETHWPLLCISCLEHLEDVSCELFCPFYVSDARCAADCENGLRASGCGGRLCACHFPELLGGRAGREDGHEG